MTEARPPAADMGVMADGSKEPRDNKRGRRKLSPTLGLGLPGVPQPLVLLPTLLPSALPLGHGISPASSSEPMDTARDKCADRSPRCSGVVADVMEGRATPMDKRTIPPGDVTSEEERPPLAHRSALPASTTPLLLPLTLALAAPSASFSFTVMLSRRAKRLDWADASVCCADARGAPPLAVGEGGWSGAGPEETIPFADSSALLLGDMMLPSRVRADVGMCTAP